MLSARNNLKHIGNSLLTALQSSYGCLDIMQLKKYQRNTPFQQLKGSNPNLKMYPATAGFLRLYRMGVESDEACEGTERHKGSSRTS